MRFQNLKVVDHWRRKCTPPKTNMEPENTPLEEEKHLQTTNFWVPCWFSGEYIITVDGSLKSGINSPVEGKVVEIYSLFFKGFCSHPNGGWEWDFSHQKVYDYTP